MHALEFDTLLPCISYRRWQSTKYHSSWLGISWVYEKGYFEAATMVGLGRYKVMLTYIMKTHKAVLRLPLEPCY